MDKKQGEESTEFMKEPTEDKPGYIFKKNSKTQIAILIIAVVILLLIAVLFKSGMFLTE